MGYLCPVAGRRAPELACGAASQYFEQLGGSQLHQVRKAGLQIEADPSDIQELSAGEYGAVHSRNASLHSSEVAVLGCASMEALWHGTQQ